MPKTKMPKPAARVYRAASYARLSVDDESYGTSGSVLNQHAMIRDFADANGGLSIVAEYSDDGFSGSTFENRPGWGSLLADVEAGKIDCIVVKDLSRLGRNYLDVSRYLDQVFPALGVRVVAIADGYDSVAEKTPTDALLLRRVRWRLRPLRLRQGVGPRPRQARDRPGTRRCCARHLRCAHRRHERRRHSRHAQ